MRLLALLICCLLLCSPARAVRMVVLRDTIGCDAMGENCTSTSSNGQAGASSSNFGASGGHPGSIFFASDSGKLAYAKFVIFVEDTSNQPIHDATQVKDELNLTFNFWNDGLLGSGDTFEANPYGNEVNGHSRLFANNPAQELGLTTIESFGQTGPPLEPDRFTTFLVTVDLISLDVSVSQGQQYVFNIIQDLEDFTGSPLQFRQSGSALSLPIEDVWFSTNDPSRSPGYVQSQHGASYHNFASLITIVALEGDYNSDGTVDLADYTVWRNNLGATGLEEWSPGDGNGDGDVTVADYDVWRSQFGMSLDDTAASASTAQLAVPEPTSALLLTIGLLLAVRQVARWPQPLTSAV